MSNMQARAPRPAGNPKRTMTAQLRALRNTAMVMFAVFMILLLAFVWMVTAINKKPSAKSEGTTTTTTAQASGVQDSEVATTPEVTDTTPEPTTVAAHASYPEGTKLIALTFDDGPCQYTPEVLDALERNGVVATFFMLGQNVKDTDAAVIQRMLDLGCELGNHTWSHQILTKVDENGAYEELQKCDDALMEKVGQHATVIRPPTGAGLKNYGMYQYALDNKEYLVNWNASSCPSDWQEPALGDADYTAQYVIDHAIEYDMVLLHDSHKSTVESLDKMIAGLKEKGYVFVTVSQLLEATSDKIGIEEAHAAGWTAAVEAYPGGPVYGVRYEYQNDKFVFEDKP